MRKTLLPVIIAILSTFVLLSCGKEDGMLANPEGSINPNPGGNNGGNNGNPNNSAKKCYVTEATYKSDVMTYVTKYNYNSKNLLESKDEDGSKSTYEYDANNRVTKITLFDIGKEIFEYKYDSKGNISKATYQAFNTPLILYIKEFNYTFNSKSQVEKVEVVAEDGNIDFFFEYDSKSNIKKILVNVDGIKQTLLENTGFDDKSNVYVNTNMAKASYPMMIVGLFFSENFTYMVNNNNILTDKVLSFFTGDMETATYTYGYTAEGYPSKMTVLRKYDGETEKEEETYTYSCK